MFRKNLKEALIFFPQKFAPFGQLKIYSYNFTVNFDNFNVYPAETYDCTSLAN